MSHSELKGFICRNDAGKEYTVIEYRPPAQQITPDKPNAPNTNGIVRFFRTKGLEVIQINPTTFKIVKTGEVIKCEIPI